MAGRLIVALTAGGTGGHVFPAQALSSELTRRGHEVHLITDPRGLTYGGSFAVRATHVVSAATPSVPGVFAKAKALFQLFGGSIQAYRLLKRLRCDVVVGFGGYPTVPPVMAASVLGVPTVIHEANAVLGRANMLLAKRATAVAVSLPQTAGLGGAEARTHLVGNPVRDAVRAAVRPYLPPETGGRIRLLVVGGSQGAHVFSHLVPDALELLPEGLRKRIELTQQVRADDQADYDRRMQSLGIQPLSAPFFANLPELIADAHFVVCRSGASTVSELAAIGRPALLVPYPHALDHDQRRNAAALMAAGGAVSVEESDLSPQRLADELGARLGDPDGLAAAAAAAKSTGHPDAVERLADLVEQIAGKAA